MVYIGGLFSIPKNAIEMVASCWVMVYTGDPFSIPTDVNKMVSFQTVCMISLITYCGYNSRVMFMNSFPIIWCWLLETTLEINAIS